MRDTIDMAREADLIDDSYASDWYVYQLKAFEALVRADEREALQAEVLEQCRINGMSAEREDALRAELTRLNRVNAELVEACKAALSDDQPYIEKCRAALAKATGETK
jgi:hypothetical protein